MDEGAARRARILDIVDKLYELSAVGDFDAAERLYLTEDLLITEAPELPMGGEYRGARALRELYGKVMGLVDAAALNRRATMVGEDCAVVHLQIEFADPQLEPAEIMEFFRFRDGKVCEIKPFYFQPEVFWRATKAKQSA